MVVVTDSVTNLFSSSSERDRRFRVDDRPAVRLSQQIMKQRARKNKCSVRSNIMIEANEFATGKKRERFLLVSWILSRLEMLLLAG